MEGLVADFDKNVNASNFTMAIEMSGYYIDKITSLEQMMRTITIFGDTIGNKSNMVKVGIITGDSVKLMIYKKGNSIFFILFILAVIINICVVAILIYCGFRVRRINNFIRGRGRAGNSPNQDREYFALMFRPKR